MSGRIRRGCRPPSERLIKESSTSSAIDRIVTQFFPNPTFGGSVYVATLCTGTAGCCAAARCGNLMLRANRTPPANLPANPPANVQLRELRELRRGHGTASGAPGIDGFERRNPTTTKSTALTFTGSRVTPQWLRGDSWSEKFDHRTWRRFHRFSCSAIILWPTSSWTDHGAPAACWAFA